MGLELRLLPQYSETLTKDNCFSHDVLSLDQDLSLFDRFIKEQAKNGIDGKINSFLARGENGEATYGEVSETPYGEPLKSLKALTLKKLFRSQINLSWRNEAVADFIYRIPDKLPVFLYWH